MRYHLCALIFTSCTIFALAQSAPSIHGIWQNSDFGYQMTLILNGDGSGEFDGESIQYQVSGNQLLLNAGGVFIAYNFNLDAKGLQLSGGDIEGTLAFKKSGATTTVDARPTERPVSASPGTNKNLVGTWSGNGETIEFKVNGDCTYLGNTYKYQSTTSNLTLITANGNVSLNYEITGDQLKLIGPSGQATYSRGSGNANPVATTGGVAMELVGEWCWINVSRTNSGGSQSSRCITLNQDGTYQYYAEGSMSVQTNAYAGGTASQRSDTGTWWLEGDRLHYRSQTSGQGSYKLEKRNHPKNVNDPMIVLDGEAYVTATYRQPWR